MGNRLNKIPLSAAVYKTVPLVYRTTFSAKPDTDPELPTIEATYLLCHETVFGVKSRQYIGNNAHEIIALARTAGCSLRLYFLANMLGWLAAQEERCELKGVRITEAFPVKSMLGTVGLNRATAYAETCRKKYGAFSVGTLNTLLDSTATDVYSRVLRSELEAGIWYVGFKIRHEGKALEKMFQDIELKLDPYWLAINEDYYKLVLQPYLKNKSGPEELQRHRFNVTQTIGMLKRNQRIQKSIFLCRQQCQPEAVSRICAFYHYSPSRFLIADAPVTNIVELWLNLSRAMQQDQLLNLIYGESSIFNR